MAAPIRSIDTRVSTYLLYSIRIDNVDDTVRPRAGYNNCREPGFLQHECEAR